MHSKVYCAAGCNACQYGYILVAIAPVVDVKASVEQTAAINTVRCMFMHQA